MAYMTQRERMNQGLIYDPGDNEILKEQMAYLEYLYDYNATRPSKSEKREKLMKTLFLN
jgi:galactoside O-acetyltransferase